jgi:glucokinase
VRDDAPRLVADIGGTRARFAFARPGERIAAPAFELGCDDYPDIAALLAMALARARSAPRAACLAVAGPVGGARVALTNRPWSFAVEELRARCALVELKVVNDFAALARGLASLGGNDTVLLGTAAAPADAGAPLAVLGPGTGLGVAAWLPGAARVVSGEGGHASFAPRDAREDDLLARLRAAHGAVSNEALLSGPGLVAMYGCVCARRGTPAALAAPETICSAGLGGTDAAAAETLEMFCAALGGFAGDVALTFGARGGIFLGGGIAPRLIEVLARGGFRARFEDKGPMRDYLAAIPTRVITGGAPALNGALALLAEA